MFIYGENVLYFLLTSKWPENTEFHGTDLIWRHFNCNFQCTHMFKIMMLSCWKVFFFFFKSIKSSLNELIYKMKRNENHIRNHGNDNNYRISQCRLCIYELYDVGMYVPCSDARVLQYFLCTTKEKMPIHQNNCARCRHQNDSLDFHVFCLRSRFYNK